MIKNLIFDIGNVLMEYRGYEMLQDYGLNEEESHRVGDEIFCHEIWSHLDLGVSIEKVIKEYQSVFPEYHDLIQWFLTHVEDMPIYWEDVWDKVHSLKEQGYHIYILSNYSREMLNIHAGNARFWDDVDGAVVSADCGLLKPNAEIYQYLLSKFNLKAEETVFFDDRLENTEAAKKLGIESYRITSKKYLFEVLEQFTGFC